MSAGGQLNHPITAHPGCRDAAAGSDGRTLHKTRVCVFHQKSSTNTYGRPVNLFLWPYISVSARYGIFAQFPLFGPTAGPNLDVGGMVAP